MTLTKEQMIERGKQWKLDAIANHRGHLCPTFNDALVDDRDPEFARCSCVHNLTSTPEPELTEG